MRSEAWPHNRSELDQMRARSLTKSNQVRPQASPGRVIGKHVLYRLNSRARATHSTPSLNIHRLHYLDYEPPKICV